MEYSDIISDNCENHCRFSWWPKFAYHYTDITNVTNILNTGYLYSRVNAEKMNIMRNDNASRQVIDMTKTEAIANVRFYFRPLTPTQYYNEGFKHELLRYDNDPNANVPVPVFLLFDLEKLISMPDVRFSECAQSGYGGSTVLSGIESFQKLDFNKIYSDGPWEDAEVKKYRHAEILYPNAFRIEHCLQVILCRNDIEKTTLLNLLKAKNPTIFYKYKSIIKICKENMFEKNGLFVSEFVYHDGTVSISFSNTYSKNKYIDRMIRRNEVETLCPINTKAEFEWIDAKGKEIIYSSNTTFKLEYRNTPSVAFDNLPKFKQAKTLRMRLFFDDNLVCLIEQPFAEIELI